MGRTKQSSSSFWHSRRRASSAPATPRPEPVAADDPPVGCMSMVHYLIFAPGAGCVGRPPTSSTAIVSPHDLHHHSTDDRRRDSQGNGSKSGFEAPRNSLDLDADNPNEIQIGVQIEPVFDALAMASTNMRRPKPTAPSSEADTPRTPSLVARLMGIDGLPDHHQPSPSPAKHSRTSSKSNKHAAVVVASSAAADKENSSPAGSAKKRVIPAECMNRRRREPLRSLSCNVVVGAEARSLPDTPRASTSARASWDGPRLSLQALKDSVLDRAAQYMSMPSSPTSTSSAGKKNDKDGGYGRRRRDERQRERVAKEHAREILRQAKENVASRKAPRSKSSSPAPEKRQTSFGGNKENVSPPPPVEDKLVVVQLQAAGKGKNKPTTVGNKAQPGTEHPPRVPLAPRQQPPPPPPQRAKPSRPPPPPPPLDPPTRARKPDGCERFATRMKKPAAGGGQQAPASSSSPVALPSAPAGSAAVVQCQPLPLEEDPEYSYLRTVLERGGFMRSPPRRPGRAFKGHSMASPVDPIVFHLLELELPADEARLGPLRHRWNRKLLFHLAQELLADLLLDLDAAAGPAAAAVSGGAAAAPGGSRELLLATTGLPLLGKVWRKVRSFPALDCRVVGDIDALVATDLESSSSAVRRLALHPAVAEEAGDVAEEVAERVLEALLGECVAESVSLSCSRYPGLRRPPQLTRSSSSSSRAR